MHRLNNENSKNTCSCISAFETGLRDRFRHMLYTILKVTYDKLPPKVITHRCYRDFLEPPFREELTHKNVENPPELR